MQQDILLSLLDRYMTGDLTAPDRKLLASLIDMPENQLAVEEFVKQVLLSDQYRGTYDPQIKERLDRFVSQLLPKEKEPQRPLTYFNSHAFRYAAAFILIIATTFYLVAYKNNTSNESGRYGTAEKSVVPPGGNRAILTLADGTTIVLDSASNGSLASQGNIRIIKLESGHLAYAADHLLTSGEPEHFNTISTPRGGQYQVILSDGSHVWLNAASSIRFPAAFPETERQIEVTGEAYLEVAADRKKPFIVKAGSESIHVLGTGFNVNAYEDEEAIKTTLVEGSIQVVHQTESFLLQPGKQAIAEKAGAFKMISVDVRQETAWKNGLFQFAGADLRSVMRQLGRWYNVDIVFPSKVPGMKFSGEIQRSLNLEDVVDILKDSEVNIELKNRVLIIKT